MAAPFDLTRRLGEGWCVTVAPLAPEVALQVMGVDLPAELPDGLDQASRRAAQRAGDVLLLAKAVESEAGTVPDAAFVLEVEGTIGWLGADPLLLGDLSGAGVACSISRDPDKVQVLIAEDGETVAGLDAVSLRRWGRFDPKTAAALTVAGFPDGDDEPGEELAGWTAVQRAAAALTVVTGVVLTADLLDDSWVGGLTSGAA